MNNAQLLLFRRFALVSPSVVFTRVLYEPLTLCVCVSVVQDPPMGSAAPSVDALAS